MEVFELTLTFSGLIGIILFLLFSSDSANRKITYMDLYVGVSKSRSNIEYIVYLWIST